MQLPPRDPNGHVPVRRLWSGAFGEENREAGAIVRVPSGIAVRMVLAGDAMPVFVDEPAAPPSGALVEAIRVVLRSDAELHGLLIGARAYAFHDAGGAAARQRAGERLRRIIGGLPRALCPASYSAEGIHEHVRRRAGRRLVRRPGGAALPDPRPQGRRRRFQLLVRFFEALRGGRTTARGQLPCGLSIDVPPEIWAATNVVIDLITGAVAA